jgi:uncharacterized protein with HEPN domain
MLRDDVTLLDIAKSARLILVFIQGMGKEAFLEDVKTQSSVMYQLMVMGEAVKRLSSEFRAAHADIPWSLIAGMRDHLIHAYDTVDWEEVWKTASLDLPDLLAKLEPLLPLRHPGETV